MKNKHFNLTSGIVLILIPLVFSFTGCRDDWSVNQATKSLPSS